MVNFSEGPPESVQPVSSPDSLRSSRQQSRVGIDIRGKCQTQLETEMDKVRSQWTGTSGAGQVSGPASEPCLSRFGRAQRQPLPGSFLGGQTPDKGRDSYFWTGLSGARTVLCKRVCPSPNSCCSRDAERAARRVGGVTASGHTHPTHLPPGATALVTPPKGRPFCLLTFSMFAVFWKVLQQPSRALISSLNQVSNWHPHLKGGPRTHTNLPWSTGFPERVISYQCV